MAEEKYNMTATTFNGLEEILAAELSELGADDIAVSRRAVTFSGDLTLMYRANYRLRTAIRILKPLFQFKADNPGELYSQIRDIDWSKVMDVGNTFLIDPVISGSVFRHSRFVAQKTKDAIVDQFSAKFRRRPSVTSENPEIRIHLLIREEDCQVSLDSSGESLHKRGYRRFGGIAPLSEVLAAGILQACNWDPSIPLADPMCGSGTILTEASMMARNIPAGHYRKEWSFMHWPDYQRMLWKRIRQEEDRNIRAYTADIRGSDLDHRSVFQALANLEQVGMAEHIPIENIDIRGTASHLPKGMVITNPPYDIRVKEAELRTLYRDIGKALKSGYPGWQAWIFSARLEALRNTGIKPSEKVILFNGPLECRLVRYELFPEA